MGLGWAGTSCPGHRWSLARSAPRRASRWAGLWEAWARLHPGRGAASACSHAPPGPWRGGTSPGAQGTVGAHSSIVNPAAGGNKDLRAAQGGRHVSGFSPRGAHWAGVPSARHQPPALDLGPPSHGGAPSCLAALPLATHADVPGHSPVAGLGRAPRRGGGRTALLCPRAGTAGRVSNRALFILHSNKPVQSWCARVCTSLYRVARPRRRTFSYGPGGRDLSVCRPTLQSLAGGRTGPSAGGERCSERRCREREAQPGCLCPQP